MGEVESGDSYRRQAADMLGQLKLKESVQYLRAMGSLTFFLAMSPPSFEHSISVILNPTGTDCSFFTMAENKHMPALGLEGKSFFLLGLGPTSESAAAAGTLRVTVTDVASGTCTEIQVSPGDTIAEVKLRQQELAGTTGELYIDARAVVPLDDQVTVAAAGIVDGAALVLLVEDDFANTKMALGAIWETSRQKLQSKNGWPDLQRFTDSSEFATCEGVGVDGGLVVKLNLARLGLTGATSCTGNMKLILGLYLDIPVMDKLRSLTEVDMSANRQLTAASLEAWCASPPPRLEKLLLGGCGLTSTYYHFVVAIRH